VYKRQIYHIAESNRIETFLPELECSRVGTTSVHVYATESIVFVDAVVCCFSAQVEGSKATQEAPRRLGSEREFTPR